MALNRTSLLHQLNRRSKVLLLDALFWHLDTFDNKLRNALYRCGCSPKECVHFVYLKTFLADIEDRLSKTTNTRETKLWGAHRFFVHAIMQSINPTKSKAITGLTLTRNVINALSLRDEVRLLDENEMIKKCYQEMSSNFLARLKAKV